MEMDNMTIQAKIERLLDRYHIILRDDNRERRIICMVWGHDYSVKKDRYGYEITIRKNGQIISVLDVDDYTCKPWKNI